MNSAAPSRQLLLALTLFSLCMLLYWPGVNGGFLFDDYHNIVTNAFVQIKELSLESLLRASQGYSGGTRQLPMLTFALNAYWAGLDPWAYKVTGLVVHAVNAVLIGLLALRLLAFSPAIGERQRVWAAFALALVWALHPLQVSSALYIVQRMETLCFTFLFITMLLYLQARGEQIANGRSRKRLWLGMLVCVLLALLSKENAVLLPLFLLAFELCLLHFNSASPRQARLWKGLYLGGTVLAVLVFFFWAVPHYYSAELHQGRDFNTPQRLLTQCRVLVMHLQQILLPLPSTIYFYYDDLPVSTGWLQPISTLLSFFLLATLLAAALLWRKRYPLAALGILLFFASHFLTSNVIALEMVFEHRNYFALFGILLTVADLISRIPLRDGPKLKYFAVAMLVSGLAFLGVVRAATWGDPLLLATDMTHKNPGSVRAGMDMANIYYEMADGHTSSPFYQFAAGEFQRISQLPAAGTAPMVNLLLMASTGELPDEMLELDSIWQQYVQRLSSSHLSVETRDSIWALLERRVNGGDIDDTHLQQALSIIFERTDASDYRHAQTADYFLFHLRDEQQAVEHYRQAITKARANGNQPLLEAVANQLAKSGYPKLASELTGIVPASNDNLLDRLHQNNEVIFKLKEQP